MAFNLKGKTMAEATEMLNNALDKADAGEQIVNGKIIIEKEDGTPVEVTDDNQVITKAHLDNTLKPYTESYATLNINIPFHMDMDAYIQVEVHADSGINNHQDSQIIHTAHMYTRRELTGISVPKHTTCTILYHSARFGIKITENIDIKDENEYNIKLQPPVATLFKESHKNSGGKLSASECEEALDSLSSGVYTSLKDNTKYFCMFITESCSVMLPNKEVDMFILGAGSDANDRTWDGEASEWRGYGVGGKIKEVSYDCSSKNQYAYITIGAEDWYDSSVKISNEILSNDFETIFTTEKSAMYSNKNDGVYPFGDESFVYLYGASGTDGETDSSAYNTGGGWDGYVSSSSNALSDNHGKFYGAGGSYRNHGSNAGVGDGYQGIVIMRWEVE